MPDHISDFINYAKTAQPGDCGDLSAETIRAAAKELKRLRRGERKRAELARRNGAAGGRPRAPDSEIKPASLKRRAYREKA
jgi:hypothetical protein